MFHRAARSASGVLAVSGCVQGPALDAREELDLLGVGGGGRKTSAAGWPS